MLHLYWFNDSVPTGELHVPCFQSRAELDSTAVMVCLQDLGSLARSTHAHERANVPRYLDTFRTCGAGGLVTGSWLNCRSASCRCKPPSCLSLVRGRLDQRQYPGVEPGQKPEAATNRSKRWACWLGDW